MIDDLGKQIGQLLKRQNDKDMPRVYFSQGITCLQESKNKMSAHEMEGVLVLLLLILCILFLTIQVKLKTEEWDKQGQRNGSS